MAEIVPYAALAIMVIAIWFAGLARLDVFTPSDLKAWRRLAGLRGYAAPRGRVEQIAIRVPALRRLQEELDLHRVLAIAGRSETPLGFLAGSGFAAGVIAAALVAGTLGYRSLTGAWFAGVGPWIGLAALPLVPLVLLTRLRGAARRRQQQAGRALGDSMMLVAIMTDGRGLQLDDAVRVLARCVTDDALETLVDGEAWRQLIPGRPRSTIELYRAIAREYQIPLFATVADAADNANLGFAEREVYTGVATGVYAQRLATARIRAARAKTLVTLPIAAMLLPLLLLLGAPALSTISGGLGAH